MSNHLAIATATETLRQIVDGAAQQAVPGASVVPAKPETGANAPAGAEIRIFLYQVTPNASWRNEDLPARRSDGTISQRPQVALDLHYLFSFYGNDQQHEPQRLLGSVASALHARPVLSREAIKATIAAALLADPNHYLKDSDLAEQIDLVRVTPSPLNLEELSKLWSVFFHTSYVLSVAYQATVILIESQDMPGAALPVRDRGIYVIPIPQPVIEEVVADTGGKDSIVATSVLLIKGHRLKGDITKVLIGGHDLTSEITDLRSDQITLALPSPLPNGMYAGIQSVRVVHQLDIGKPPTPHRGFESNVVAFVLRPILNPPPALVAPPTSELIGGMTVKTGELQVNFEPNIGAKQRVVLLLNENTTNVPAHAYNIQAPPDNGIVAPVTDTASIVFPFERVAAGNYLVRVQVDGAESPLGLNASGQYATPEVTI